jgi:hypothetical protein
MLTEPSRISSSPYPGRWLFQESFFVCTVKNFGDAPLVRDIYVETVVDTNCKLGFARVYPSINVMNGVDILQDRVLPFYNRYDAKIERIFTPSTREYCGLAPIHPFETLLATSQIEHHSVDPQSWLHVRPSEDFHHALSAEFFKPAIRKYSYRSFDKLQQDLDIFVEKYNHERPYHDGSSAGVTPFVMFLTAIGIPTGGGQGPEASLEGHR